MTPTDPNQLVKESYTVIRNSAALGLVSLFMCSVCDAQYADEESCAALANLQLPELEHELLSSESIAGFEQQFRKLNPESAAEITDSFQGSMYFTLAECYWSGIVVEKDRPLGKSIMRLAALKGSRPATHMIASIDVFQSDDPARQRTGFAVLKAEYVEQNSAYAAGKLGWAYQRGLGVEEDLDKAMELYSVAAEGGMTYWQYLLAHAYERGYLGLDSDPVRAQYWREFKPKVHIALYECWVATYYRDGIFPANEELASKYQKICDETDISEVWE